MKRLVAAFIGIAFAMIQAQAVTVEVAMNVKSVSSFVEFKIESDEKGEKATGQIKDKGEQKRTFEMGKSNQNIWFWWDTLDGSADITIKVDGTIVFDGTCTSNGKGERSVLKTCAKPRISRTTGSPNIRAVDEKKPNIVHIFF